MKMLESIYFTSVEKRDFLNEFVDEMILSVEKYGIAKIKEKEISENEREDALERVRLIIRQFPGIGVRRVTMPEEESIETPVVMPAVKTSEVHSEERILTGMDKIDSLLNDPAIRLIECSDGIVKISKGDEIEETGFRLTEQEIQEIVKQFSQKTKIPLNGSVFKANYGNLMINAIVSDIISSRLILIKEQ